MATEALVKGDAVENSSGLRADEPRPARAAAGVLELLRCDVRKTVLFVNRCTLAASQPLLSRVDYYL